MARIGLMFGSLAMTAIHVAVMLVLVTLGYVVADAMPGLLAFPLYIFLFLVSITILFRLLGGLLGAVMVLFVSIDD